MDDFKEALRIAPLSAEIYVNRSITRMGLKDYKNALIDVDSAIKIKNDIPLAYLARGLIKHQLNDTLGAIADINKAIQLNYFFTEAYIRRGSIKYDIGDYKGAIDDFTQAIKMEPDNPAVYFQRAIAWIKLENKNAAFDDLNKVLELDPYNALTYYNRAIIKGELGDLKGALEDYNHVLALNPDNILAAYNRAITRHQLEDYHGAIEDYTKAINLFPDFSKAYFMRAEAKRMLKDEKGAFEDRNKAIQIEETIAKTNDSILRLYTDSTYLASIIEFEADFRKTSAVDGRIQYQPVYVDLEQNFIVTYLYNDSLNVEQKRGEYWLKKIDDIGKKVDYKLSFGLTNKETKLTPEQIALYLKNIDLSTKLNPSDPLAYFFMGILNGMIKNYQSALDAYNKALELDPGFSLAYFNRANTRLEMLEELKEQEPLPVAISFGNNMQQPRITEKTPLPEYQEVINDYNKVIELNPDFSFAWFNRANIKARIADYESALQDYSIAIQLEPNLAQAYYNRALILIYQHNNQPACQDLSRAGELGIANAYNLIKRYCSLKN